MLIVNLFWLLWTWFFDWEKTFVVDVLVLKRDSERIKIVNYRKMLYIMFFLSIMMM